MELVGSVRGLKNHAMAVLLVYAAPLIRSSVVHHPAGLEPSCAGAHVEAGQGRALARRFGDPSPDGGCSVFGNEYGVDPPHTPTPICAPGVAPGAEAMSTAFPIARP